MICFEGKLLITNDIRYIKPQSTASSWCNRDLQRLIATLHSNSASLLCPKSSSSTAVSWLSHTIMDQVLTLTPSDELEFQQPVTGPVCCYLRLKNVTSQNVIFKVKTTSPDLFIVKPNQGLLRLGEEALVSITLKGLEVANIAKQKFQIQAMPTTQSQVADIPAALSGTQVAMRVLPARFGNKSEERGSRVSAVADPGVGLDLRQYKEQLLAEKATLEKQVADLQAVARKTPSVAEVGADAEASKGYSLLHLCVVLVLGLIIGSSLLGRQFQV